jgi:choline oxidase
VLILGGGTAGCALAARLSEDEERVHGLEKLRVVDAFAVPEPPRANTDLTVLAMAERAAEVLRAGD